MLTLPDKFNSLLSRGDAATYRLIVDSAMTQFIPWIEASRMTFFPEYTDHGPKHIQNVIFTVNDLITDQSQAIVTPADVMAVTIAAILHDSAMHLEPEGFVELVKPSSDSNGDSYFGDRPWDSIWREYLYELRRTSYERLAIMFGSKYRFREPDFDDLSESDRMVIGEFLRRHHARLSHEIALNGVPGGFADRLRLTGGDERLYDMLGVIARSHGIELRKAVDYLEPTFGHKHVWRNIHAVYLMTLLRNADNLQIQATRAPGAVLKTRKMRSPISDLEWHVHGAITDIRTTNDPEAIFIEAEPKDIQTYLRIKTWLSNIQFELDESWAVLGEVYGLRHSDHLDDLSLILRRVRSNLDDERRFAAQASYVPVAAKFRAADAEILKLLIRPLYGSDPYPGIRELLQNSIDAVLAASDRIDKQPELANLDFIKQNADVVISITTSRKKDKHILTITDRGIGMSAEDIVRYFLVAGASSRQGDFWMRQFIGEDGRTTILRSGRFGIGVLAAFLLGNQVEVTTRHMDLSRTEGIRFTASVSDDLVELERVEADIGTCIKIQLTDTVCEQLCNHTYHWDWYCFDKPSVLRVINRREVRSYHREEFRTDRPLTKWHQVNVKGFDRVSWYSSENRRLILNGIVVGATSSEENSRLRPIDLPGGVWRIWPPAVSILDREGNAQISADRTQMETSQFSAPIRTDMIEDFLGLVISASKGDLLWGLGDRLIEKNRHGLDFASKPIVFASKGYTLLEDFCLRKHSLSELILWTWPSSNIDQFTSLCAPSQGLLIAGRQGLDYREQWMQMIGDKFPDTDIEVCGIKVLVRKDSLLEVQAESAEPLDDYWFLANFGECKSSDSTLINRWTQNWRKKQGHKRQSTMSAPVLFFVKPKSEFPTSAVGKLWHKLISDDLIPYDLSERHQLLPRAFERLKTHLRPESIRTKRSLI